MARILIAVAGCVMTVAMAAVAAWAGERLTVRRTVLLLLMALGIGVFCCRCGAQLATNYPAYAYKWWVTDNDNVLQYEMRTVNGSGIPAANNTTYLVINKNEGVVVSNVSFQVAWAALQQCAADFDHGNYTDGTTGAYGKPFGSIPGKWGFDNRCYQCVGWWGSLFQWDLLAGHHESGRWQHTTDLWRRWGQSTNYVCTVWGVGDFE